MAVSKIQFDGHTLIDLTADTVTAGTLRSGYTAHGANGEQITGTLALPSGSMNITANGTYDVTNKASAVVAVPAPATNCKSFSVTVATDQTSRYVVSSADSDIAAHRSDSTFYVGFAAQFSYSSGLSARGGFNTNQNLTGNTSGPTYGIVYRINSSGANTYTVITKSATESGGEISTTSSGEIFIYAGSTLVLRAGTYTVFCGW